MKSKTLGVLGGVLLGGMILMAVCAELIAPYSPYQSVGKPFERPGSVHILGTNDIGQDIWSELIYGARNSLLVGVLSAGISLVIGTLAGVLAGWYGGGLGRLLMKITAFFLTIPFLPSVIILAAFMRGGVWSMSLILGIMSWPSLARVLHASVLQIKDSVYIRIIRGMGAGNAYIITRHILRELAPLILYRGMMRFKAGILSESYMSFLGLGNPAAKSWGAIIYYAQVKNALLTGAWVWWIIPPGICISLSSMALMMISYSMESWSNKRIGTAE
jgi:ABC-type dipeptide/oligopeptide/nickel transport system permease subunit